MPGLFSDVDQQNQMADATRAPVAGPTTTASDSFSAALTQSETNDSAYSKAFNESDFIQSKLDEYKAKTGQSLSNPGLQSPLNPLNNFIYNQRVQALRDTFAAKAKELNDPTIAFPSDDEIAQGGIGLARAATLRQEQLGQQSQAFGAGVAGFVGGQIVSLPSNAAAIATIPEGGLGAKMLGAAAGFGGVQLFNDLTQYGYRKAVNPNYGPEQIAKDVAEQAAGGAAFELGGKLVGDAAGALWRRFKGVAPEVADRVPQETQDAGNVAERKGDLNAQNPFEGPAGTAAHNEALVKTEQDMQAERPVQLPASALDKSIVRGPDPEAVSALVDRANAHPDPDINRIGSVLDGRDDLPPVVSQAANAIIDARDQRLSVSENMNNGPDFHSDDAQLATGLFLKPDGSLLSKADMNKNLDALGQEPAPPQVRGPLPEPTPLARTTPEEADKVAQDPNVHASMAADLQRNIEQGRNRVPSYDADGKVQAGVADSELAAIERQEAAAKEIANCTTPVVEGAEE